MRHALGQQALKAGVDSAGTHDYHVGEAPDRRSIHTARQRGVDIADLRGRQVAASDFHEFDLILALDETHHRILKEIRPAQAKGELALFLEYAGHNLREVPDPYYGDGAGFERVYDMIEEGVAGVINKIRPRLEQ